MKKHGGSRSGSPRVAAAALVMVPFLFGFILSSRGVTAQQGIYSNAQAARGQAVYDKRCASCHGPRLSAGSASALAGSAFMAKWGRGNRSVDDLFFITRTQMPYEAAGTLTRQQYIDVVAFILKANGYPAGARELAADSATLKRIKLEPQGSVKE